MSNTVKVCVRIRPLSDTEFHRGDGLSLYASNDQTVKIISSSNNNNQDQQHQIVDTSSFQFDQVFGPDSTQQDVFDKSDIESCCEAVLNGLGVTILHYGQTGSGKTHTMSGPPSSNFIWNSVLDSSSSSSSSNDQKHKEIANQFVEFLNRKNNKQFSIDPKYEMLFQSLGLQFRAGVYLLRRVEGLLLQQKQQKQQQQQQQHSNSAEQITIRAAMYEIYNEQVNDLLNETQNLKVRLSPSSHTFFVENLMLVTITSLEDLFAVLAQGESSRKRCSHSDSTRSHVIFSLGIERIVLSSIGENNNNINENDLGGIISSSSTTTTPIIGKINFVDLAGSEKAYFNHKNNQANNNNNWYQQQINNNNNNYQKNSGSGEIVDSKIISAVPTIAQKFGPQNLAAQQQQTELLEARKINQSLHVLGKVISALAANNNNNNNNNNMNQGGFFSSVAHIPFRDSTLTKLLMDSLSGQALTLMIACVSPSSKSVDESKNTLQYATMARSISGYRHVTSNVSARVDAGQSGSSSQLRKELELLRRENISLRKLLMTSTEEKQLLKRQLEQAVAFNAECLSGHSNQEHQKSCSPPASSHQNDNHNSSIERNEEHQQEQEQSFDGEIGEGPTTITRKESFVPELESKTSLLYVVPVGPQNEKQDQEKAKRRDSSIAESDSATTANALKKVEHDNATLREEVEELKRLVLDISRRSAAAITVSAVLSEKLHENNNSNPSPPSSLPNKDEEKKIIDEAPKNEEPTVQLLPARLQQEPQQFYGFVPSTKKRASISSSTLKIPSQQEKPQQSTTTPSTPPQQQQQQQTQPTNFNPALSSSSSSMPRSTRALPLSLGSLAFETVNKNDDS